MSHASARKLIQHIELSKSAIDDSTGMLHIIDKKIVELSTPTKDDSMSFSYHRK